MSAPSWLLPTKPMPAAKGRIVGEPDKRVRRRLIDQRWRMIPQGRAYLRAKVRDPNYKAARKESHKRWLESPKGRAWLERNRERRNHYCLMRYHADPARQEYARRKQREYRAAKRAANERAP